MIINDLFNNKKFVAEGMAGQVVFSGTGANGGTYEIIQSGPTDFMIHANGRHIDTYGSLQRAMSVLQNEVPGLQQGMAEEVDSPLITDPQYTTDMQPARAGQKGTGLKAPREYIPIDTEKPVQPPALGMRPTSKTKVPNFEPKADFDPKIISPEEMNDINQQIQQQNLTKSDDRPMRFDVRSGKIVPVNPENPATRSMSVASDSDASGEKSNAPDPNAKWVVWDPKTRAPAVAPAVNKKRSDDAWSMSATPKSGSWQELAKLNNITDPRKLQANSWIKTPSGEIYVNKGDTLSGIAQKIRAAQRRGVSEEESEAAAQRKQYPSYYQHKDAGTIFRTQNDVGQTMNITPDDEEWDDYYRQQFPDMSTPNDEIPIRYNVDGTAVMVEGASTITHRIGLTVTDPNHPMVSKRGETIQKTVRVKGDDREKAINGAIAHYRRKGYKVHDHHYIGTVDQGMAEAFANPGSGSTGTSRGAKRIANTVRKALAKNSETPDQIAARKDFEAQTDARMRQKKKEQGMAEDDGFDVVSNYQSMRTTDTGNKSNQTYTGTTIQKNPATGQQKSLASWDHTDPATGKNYSGSNYIDAQGNAEVQKNYEESQDQLDELDKKTVANWVRQQPQRIKGDSGLSRTNFKKAQRLVDKSIPSAIAKYKDPNYGKQNPRLEENIADDMAAMAQKKFPNAYISKNGQEVQKPKNWGKPHTPPPVDQDKQRRDLADKYPNIDELVRRAELRRDPQYDRADGQAYYDGRDAEQNYHKLKQIQRMIRGAELDEMDFGSVSQTTDSDTGDVTTNFSQGPMSVSQTKTPGGYTKQSDQQVNLGTATLGAKTVGPNIGAGQLAGTTTKTATNTATGQAKQQVKGVGFGGASGSTVGKNYVGSSDDELAKHAADSTFGVNEETTQATLNTPVGDFTANITKDKSTNTVSGTMPIGGTTLKATKDMTPGGAQSFSVDKDVTPNLNLSATKKSADYNKGQLAGTRSVAAKYTDATGALGQPGQQHTATRTMGVGFGGASGANVGKNYVDQYSVNESIDRIRHLAGIKPVR